MELLMQAVQEAQPEARRARSLTRTAISRLRVDTLRSLLDQLGADSRGNKDALVQVRATRRGSQLSLAVRLGCAASSAASLSAGNGNVPARQGRRLVLIRLPMWFLPARPTAVCPGASTWPRHVHRVCW